jgi:lipopolysaccharide heptosyltransferase I
MDESVVQLKVISNQAEAVRSQGAAHPSPLTPHPSLKRIKPKRILIIKPSALGDIVHALPVATALRQRFPNAELHWIVNSTYQALLQQHPDLDQVIPFERQKMARDWIHSISYLMDFGHQLRRRRYDLVIDLQGLLRSALMVQMTGARWKVGLASAREGAGWFYNIILPDDLWSMHAVDRYWRAVEIFGAGEMQKQFRFPLLESERHLWLTSLASAPRPWVMMNLGTRWETKRWPVKHFATLSQQIVLQTGGSIILVGGPDEQSLATEFQQAYRRATALPSATDTLAHASTGKAVPHIVSTVGKTNLRELVAILSLTDLVISNDSGPLHVAAALGKTTLSPFTCTSPTRTGPYGQLQNVVRTSVPCAASYRKKCSHLSCMSELTPERLMPTLDRILQTWQRSSA